MCGRFTLELVQTVISVVIPTYNDARFLPTALASCLAQTIPVEIVLVDDGSTAPLTEEVSRFVAEHRDIVTQVRHTRNCGLSAARNTGIAHARFDLVIPLDADDWFLPGTLAPLVAVLTDEVDIAYGNVIDSGKVYEPVKRPLRRADFLEDTPIFCSSLFRKTVWQGVNGYTVRDGPHYEDWNFWAKAFKAGFRFQYAPITVYEHQSRPDSMLRYLHHERARYVQVATAPLTETAAPDKAQGEPAVAVPDIAGAVAARLADLIDPSLRDGRTDLVLRALAGEPCEGLAAGHGLDQEELRRWVRRFVEQGARALEPGERRPPALLLAHARIGQLMIELERARAQSAEIRDAPRSPELVAAHARIGQLTIELDRARAQLAEAGDSRRLPELIAAHAVIGRLMLERSPVSKEAAQDAARTVTQESRDAVTSTLTAGPAQRAPFPTRQERSRAELQTAGRIDAESNHAKAGNWSG
ncbi:MAG TPA: glycosyltransferase [Vicinamibacterales bacterium]|nr:glycosyltransferase [Vicinamibacterales bacterium]